MKRSDIMMYLMALLAAAAAFLDALEQANEVRADVDEEEKKEDQE